MIIWAVAIQRFVFLSAGPTGKPVNSAKVSIHNPIGSVNKAQYNTTTMSIDQPTILGHNAGIQCWVNIFPIWERYMILS